MKYYVIGYVDATMSGFVEANSPEEALDEAGFSPSLCHQCSNEIECCDVYDWEVLDELQDNVLIETDASNQLRAMRQRAEAAEAKLAALAEASEELWRTRTVESGLSDEARTAWNTRTRESAPHDHRPLNDAREAVRTAAQKYDDALKAARGEP